jgi:hypothetical protein
MNDLKPEGPANYIDALAAEIGLLVPDQDCPQDLLRLYAVLALTRGTMTTLEDIHDTWSAWMAGRVPTHPALIPFGELSPEVQRLDWPYAEAVQMVAGQGLPSRTRVVCLCGSARFAAEWRAAWIEIALAGHTVVGTPDLGDGIDGLHQGQGLAAIDAIRAAHLRLIDGSDEIYVLNPGGYIGDNTRDEIDHAFAAGKQIRFLESMPLEDAYAEGWVPGAPKAVRA